MIKYMSKKNKKVVVIIKNKNYTINADGMTELPIVGLERMFPKSIGLWYPNIPAIPNIPGEILWAEPIGISGWSGNPSVLANKYEDVDTAGEINSKGVIEHFEELGINEEVPVVEEVPVIIPELIPLVEIVPELSMAATQSRLQKNIPIELLDKLEDIIDTNGITAEDIIENFEELLDDEKKISIKKRKKNKKGEKK